MRIPLFGQKFIAVTIKFGSLKLLLGSAGLRSLSAVLGTSLHTLCNTLRVQRAADDVVTYTRQVLNTAATDQHNAVLLQVVTDTPGM